MKIKWLFKNYTILFVGVFIILSLLPVFTDSYYTFHVGIMLLIASIFALSVRLIYITGKVSLAQGSFVAIGAYTYSLMVIELGASFWIAMPLAALFTAAIGALIGYPSLRLSGGYFVIFTFLWTEVVRIILLNWRDLTGGPIGITRIPRPDNLEILGVTLLDFSSRVSYYYLALFLFIFVLLVMHKIDHSRFGKMLAAIRQNVTLAQSIGANLGYYNTMAFAIACFMCGLGGAFNAHYIGSLYPTSYGLWQGVDYVIYMIVGGASNVIGPIIGAIFLRLMSIQIAGFSEYKSLIFCAILVLTILFIPGGLISLPKIKQSSTFRMIRDALKRKRK